MFPLENTRFDQASFFVAHSIAVIPLKWRDKRPFGSLLPGGHWEIYKTQLPTQSDLKRWFPSYMRNYGVVLGWNNLAVLDFDDHQAYDDWKAWAGDLLNDAFKVQTNRGVHLYFTLLEERHNCRIGKIDFKKTGYVVGPGSVHPSGKIYTPLNEFNLPEIKTLDQVIPSDWLPLDTELPARIEPKAMDIFDEAEDVIDFDENLMRHLKDKWPVQEFFPDAQPSERGGRWLVAKCPFHDDHHPSFWIDTKRQICGCWKCNMKPMDSINVYAALHNMDVTQAIRIMARA